VQVAAQSEGPGGERVGDTYRTTMADVAKAAGVSRTTVSFVLNNRDGARIPPQTRERVQQVAAELGYRPHGGARALASRRSSLIGLVSEIVTSPFAAATIRGIQDSVRAAGYTLFIVPTSTEATVDGEAFETLLKSRVEGIIYATGWNCRVRMPAQAREIPTVLVHCIDPVSGLPCVRPDEEQMGRLAAQALLEGAIEQPGRPLWRGDGSLPSTASCISLPLRLFMQRPGGLALFSTSFGTLRVRY